jgi:hypothetical protein
MKTELIVSEKKSKLRKLPVLSQTKIKKTMLLIKPKSELNPLELMKVSQDLRNSLQVIAPDNDKTTRMITFALTATAIVGMFVYHYIKSQEEN